MFKILYTPRLPSGKAAPLNWFLKFYRWSNLICWPLDDSVPKFVHRVDRIYWLLGFLLCIMYNDAEVRYLSTYFRSVDDLLTGVPTYLVLIETHLRAFTLGVRKNDFKNLLKKFYSTIYIDESTNPKLFKKIKWQQWPIIAFTIFYLCAFSCYILMAGHVLLTNKRELLYKMIPRIDYKNNFYIFFFLLISNVWMGLIVATLMFGEGNILGVLVYHLNGRYSMLAETLDKKVDAILMSKSNSNIVQKYERAVRETLYEHLRLNKFAQELQNEFSFRLFISFAMSAILLCALGYKVYTSPVNSISYVFWAIGKIQEIIAFGQMGSTIINTTDQLSSMYYESRWELIIERSSNAKENVQLMKFLTLAMIISRKSFHITGLNFFDVSLNSVVKVLQGAGSYFTFLISLR